MFLQIAIGRAHLRVFSAILTNVTASMVVGLVFITSMQLLLVAFIFVILGIVFSIAIENILEHYDEL